jgi:hypothetical protein
MAARFQVQVQSCAPRSLTGLRNRQHLGVLAAFVGMRAPADDLALRSHKYRTHTRVGRSQRYSLASELQRLLHELLVAGWSLTRHLFATPCSQIKRKLETQLQSYWGRQSELRQVFVLKIQRDRLVQIPDDLVQRASLRDHRKLHALSCIHPRIRMEDGMNNAASRRALGCQSVVASIKE